MRIGESEEEHCLNYYKFMAPKKNALIVDLGCGAGGFGHYMQQIDKSLRFINVVNDQDLIDYMNSVGRVCVKCSFDNTFLPDECADNVVFNESIGHGELQNVLKEASRLLKKHGVLTIKDFSPTNPSDEIIDFSEWKYVCSREDRVIHAASENGLSLDSIIHPFEYRKHWDLLMSDDENVTRVVGGDQNAIKVRQVLYKFVKV